MATTSAPTHQRARKRPRPGEPTLAVPRRIDVYKRQLLARKQERERRRIAEAIRSLDAIEEQRRRARERKVDRERRRAEFADLLLRSTLLLQRCERGRQARRVATARARAAVTLVKWMIARVRRRQMIRAIRNRTILRIMVKVETMVQEQIEETCFVVTNMMAIRKFRQHRSARIIQSLVRKRRARRQRSVALLIRIVRAWLARGHLGRARMHRSIARYRGSLSRRALGLGESDAMAPAALLARRDGLVRQGRWWDVGPPVSQENRWGIPRVAMEEERSRQRAASLAYLIRAGGERQAANGGGMDGARRAVDAAERGHKSLAKGFGKGTLKRRGVSMVDAREAEAAAIEHELALCRARKEAAGAIADPKRLTLIEKHLLRQREFEEQREKRRLAAEKEHQRKERLMANREREEAKRKAHEAELARQREEEMDRLRRAKIRAYQEKMIARELSAKRLAASKKEQERRAKDTADVKRQWMEAASEKDKARRAERARLRRHPEPDLPRRKEAVPYRIRKAVSPAIAAGNDPFQTIGRFNKSNSATRPRPVLAPIASETQSGFRRRRRGRLRKGGTESARSPAGVRRLRATVCVRDGRRRVAHGGCIPALPTVPDWTAMAAGKGKGAGARKRPRRRPPRQETKQFRVHLRESPQQLPLEGNVSITDSESVCPGEASASTGTLTVVSGGNTQPRLGELGSCMLPDRGLSLGGLRCQLSLADDELLTMETLDSAFPTPGTAAGSGGGEGLGPTSAPGSVSSPAGEAIHSSRDTMSSLTEAPSTLSGDHVQPHGGYALPSENTVLASDNLYPSFQEEQWGTLSPGRRGDADADADADAPFPSTAGSIVSPRRVEQRSGTDEQQASASNRKVFSGRHSLGVCRLDGELEEACVSATRTQSSHPAEDSEALDTKVAGAVDKVSRLVGVYHSRRRATEPLVGGPRGRECESLANEESTATVVAATITMATPLPGGFPSTTREGVSQQQQWQQQQLEMRDVVYSS